MQAISKQHFLSSFTTVERPFANWSAHQLFVWDKHFATVEHAFQYKKFEQTNPTWAKRVKQSKSPYEAKRLAHQRNVDFGTWDVVRESVMLELIKVKLTQHEDVQFALAKTGDQIIAEAGNPGDSFWGVGKDGMGQNVLGKIWMHLRSEMQ